MTTSEIERLASIETLVKGLDKKLDKFIEAVEKDHDDHEHRLRVLEKTKWLFAGGAAVLGAFGRELLQLLGG